MSNLLWAALSVVFLSACDPCRELGDQICDCQETESSRRDCKADLNLAKAHKFFEKARDPKICQEALKSCTCEKILNEQDEECGFYRNSW